MTFELIPTQPTVENDEEQAKKLNSSSISIITTFPEQEVDKNSVDDDSSLELLPPDGGYGWVVVFVGFLGSVLTDGIGYSFGLFYPIYMREFHQNGGVVAWVGSLSGGKQCCIVQLILRT